MDDRKKYIARRFGHIDKAILGRIDDIKPIVWIDLEKHYRVNGNTLTYGRIKDIRQSAARIAQIFQNGAYEMINSSEIEWHRNADKIIQKVATGDWNFYGCYWNDKLIAAESLYITRGDSIMEWVWGCVDPPYRGMGVWQHIGEYTDAVVLKSGAQVGSVWVVTTHKYSQMSVERAGYVPMGCFIGKRVYGGADNRFYRHTLIHYAKLYGEAAKYLQSWSSMVLTPDAQKIVDAVKHSYLKSTACLHDYDLIDHTGNAK